MSYERLADQLSDTSERLRRHTGQLQGVALAGAAERLERALHGFDKQLENVVKGSLPEVAVLKQLLDSEQAQQRLHGKALRAVAKEALGKAIRLAKTDTPAQQRQRLLRAATDSRQASQACTTVRAFLAEASHRTASVGDRDALLADVWRLAALSPAGLAIEEDRLLANERLVRAMAEVAHIKVTKRATPRSLLKKLIAFSRRVEENVS